MQLPFEACDYVSQKQIFVEASSCYQTSKKLITAKFPGYSTVPDLEYNSAVEDTL